MGKNSNNKNQYKFPKASDTDDQNVHCLRQGENFSQFLSSVLNWVVKNWTEVVSILNFLNWYFLYPLVTLNKQETEMTMTFATFFSREISMGYISPLAFLRYALLSSLTFVWTIQCQVARIATMFCSGRPFIYYVQSYRFQLLYKQ